MNLLSSLSNLRRLGVRWLLLALLLTGSCCWADPDLVLDLNHPLVTNSAVLVTLDVDGDGESDATYEHNSAYTPLENTPYYSVSFFLRNTAQLRFLNGAAKQVGFSAGQVVSTTSKVHFDLGNDNYVLLLGYDSALFAQVQWNYFDTIQRSPDAVAGGHAFFTNKTEVLIGFRLTSLEAGTIHYGWVRLTRPDTLFITPFAIASYDWNPLPNEPIAAGEPPVIPLAHEIKSNGLRLSWPAQVSGWILESSEQLGPEAEWMPVPEVNATDVLLSPPEGTRFYRLRRP